jgi:hypothetical protein
MGILYISAVRSLQLHAIKDVRAVVCQVYSPLVLDYGFLEASLAHLVTITCHLTLQGLLVVIP